MSSGLEIIQLGNQIKAHFSRADQYQDKAEQHFKAAGINLLEAQQRIKNGEYGKPFTHYCQNVVGMSPSRCYEYIQIANGTKTLEQIREAKRESANRSRGYGDEFPLRSGDSQPTDSTKETSRTTQSTRTGRPAIDVISNLNKKIRTELKGKDEQQLLVILNFIKGV